VRLGGAWIGRPKRVVVMKFLRRRERYPRTGAHYLSDVLAGAALALAGVPVAVTAANAIYTRGKVTPEKLNTVVKRLAVVLFALALGLPFL
jgi:hypothetical protein